MPPKPKALTAARRGRPLSRGFHGLGCCQHRRPTQAMADQQGGRTIVRAQKISRQHQVINIRREIGIGKVTIAAAQPGKIKAQYRITPRDQRTGDTRG